ncbi:hypothetical protein T439DRAFT_349788 [Meredithblackwellia eburnea MCA 4105]
MRKAFHKAMPGRKQEEGESKEHEDLPEAHTQGDNPEWVQSKEVPGLTYNPIRLQGGLQAEIFLGQLTQNGHVTPTVAVKRYRHHTLTQGSINKMFSKTKKEQEKYNKEQLNDCRKEIKILFHLRRGDGAGLNEGFKLASEHVVELLAPLDPNYKGYIFAMTRCESWSLIEVWEEIDQTNPNDWVVHSLQRDMYFQLLSGLTWMYHRSVVHLDIRPENIVLGPMHNGKWGLKFVDFGMGRIIGETFSKVRSGSIYSPPECRRDRTELSMIYDWTPEQWKTGTEEQKKKYKEGLHFFDVYSLVMVMMGVFLCTYKEGPFMNNGVRDTYEQMSKFVPGKMKSMLTSNLTFNQWLMQVQLRHGSAWDKETISGVIHHSVSPILPWTKPEEQLGRSEGYRLPALELLEFSFFEDASHYVSSPIKPGEPPEGDTKAGPAPSGSGTHVERHIHRRNRFRPQARSTIYPFVFDYGK